MVNLDDHYDLKITPSKITKMVELVSVGHSSLKESVPRHVDKIAALVEQLRAMGFLLDDPLVIGISITSITVDELKTASAAIKTLSAEKLKWDDATSLLIEEVKTIKSDQAQSSRQVIHGDRSWSIFGQPNHRTGSCYLNLINNLTNLGVSESTLRDITDQNGSKTSGKPSKVPKKGKSTRSGGGSPKWLAMARVNKTKVITYMMLDMGTSARMIPHGNRLFDARECKTDITLAANSAVHSSEVGVRPVRWFADVSSRSFDLSETLYVPDITKNLSFVPLLVNNNI